MAKQDTVSLIPMEYIVCQNQNGIWSVVTRAHVREGRHPMMEVVMGRDQVVFNLTGLDDGSVEPITHGKPRTDHIDAYILWDAAVRQRGAFPAPLVEPNRELRHPTTNSEGTERYCGKKVRMVQPLCRLGPLDHVLLHVPGFDAVAFDAMLHMDIESAPPRDYGPHAYELHIGIDGTYEGEQSNDRSSAIVEIGMSHGLYAAIIEEMHYHCWRRAG